MSLGADFLLFPAVEGAGLADPLAFLAASHCAEPAIVLVVKIISKRNRACYAYELVPAEGVEQGKIFVGEGGTLARR